RRCQIPHRQRLGGAVLELLEGAIEPGGALALRRAWPTSLDDRVQELERQRFNVRRAIAAVRQFPQQRRRQTAAASIPQYGGERLRRAECRVVQEAVAHRYREEAAAALLKAIAMRRPWRVVNQRQASIRLSASAGQISAARDEHEMGVEMRVRL